MARPSQVVKDSYWSASIQVISYLAGRLVLFQRGINTTHVGSCILIKFYGPVEKSDNETKSLIVLLQNAQELLAHEKWEVDSLRDKITLRLILDLFELMQITFTLTDTDSRLYTNEM